MASRTPSSRLIQPIHILQNPTESSLAQPLLSQSASSHSAHLENLYSIPGRSPNRRYRCWPSSAGLDSDGDIADSDKEPKADITTQGANVTTQGVNIHPLDSARFSRRDSRKPNLGFTARLAMWFRALAHSPVTAYQAVKGNLSSAILACKVGFSCCLMSLLVLAPSKDAATLGNGVWAVITIALVYESNIGASLSKGLNRITGTFIAGGLAVVVNHVGPRLGPFHMYFVLFSLFVATAIPVFLRFGSPLKEHWNYALSMATITAHLLILGGYRTEERLKMPIARFLMIVLGFLVAAFVNLAVKPKFAGDTLHKLVTKNFKTAAEILEQCVESYVAGTELEAVPSIMAGRLGGDQTSHLYDEIVMSDTEVDKLMNFVSWEPCHGKFFRGYPWGLYGDITDNLRYTVYTIIALDGCLRAEIQAPKVLRDIFANEMRELGAEVGKVLRILHQSLRDSQTFVISDILQQAQVSALLLQMRLHDNAHRLLMERARTPSVNDFWKLAPGLQYQVVEERTERYRYRGNGSREGSVRSGYSDGSHKGRGNGQPGDGQPSNGQPGMVIPPQDEENAPGDDRPAMPERPEDDSPAAQAAWQREFFLRRDSLGRNWDGTIERIGALSLVKFASLLMELVAGLQYVVASVDLLGKQARYTGPDLTEDTLSQPSDLGDQRPESDAKSGQPSDVEEGLPSLADTARLLDRRNQRA